ncbi:MAG: glycosyltransferase family 2 protein [Deltaproteobacteria bacterium]
MAETVSISIVIPMFNEEKNVAPLYARVKEAADKLGRSYEILFVNDGSTDGTENELRKLKEKDPSVKCITFRSNFKKAAAYSAGVRYAQGDIIVTMDGDLQDDPAEMGKLIEQIERGYDYVSGWKYRGKGNPYRAWPSKMFNLVVRKTSKLDLHDFNCPFKAFRKDVIEPDEVYGELYRFLPMLASRKGYKVTEVRVENLPRIHGKSNFGLERFLRGFFDLLTMLFLTRFIKRPLHFFGFVGLILFFFGSASILTLYSIKFLFGILIQNTPFLFGLSLMGIILGIQFFSIGLVSELLINLQRKPADHYVIREIF